jgi:glyoxylase-like metal-dependent hydrolase (beta-lactamase superfamily II)
MFIANSKGVQTAVNAYLVHTGSQLLLIDAGAGACFGPTLGKMLENVRAAGYAPEDVNAVLLTHLHPDHLCGLASADGQRVFPRATLWAARADADFWLSASRAQAAPPAMQPFFAMARKSLAPYDAAGAVRLFEGNAQILPGVSARLAPGHTPGHSAFLLESGGKGLLVWGDIVHSHAVQFANPQVSIEFDTDSAQAIRTRKALFAEAAQQQWLVAGAHLPFPGLGRVRKEAKAYAWVPVEYGPLRTDR